MKTDMRPLDDNTLQQMARLICGDDTSYYRRGFELEKFLKNAKWNDIPEYDGESRFVWTLCRLRERSDTGDEIKKVILRLCDPLEYLGEPPETAAETTRALNAFLVHEGYKVERPNGRPRIVECDPSLASPGTLASVELKVTMDEVVTSPEFAQILQDRMNEAQTCSENGCWVAAIIMLGSLLEGVLLDATITRLTKRPDNLERLPLNRLIEIAHENKWIGVDVLKYCHTLRHYRNLIHPYAHIRMGEPVDRDTLNMSWPVVHATLNDLAATKKPEKT